MKQTTLITAFLFVTLLCFGQKEHLEPAKDYSKHDLKEYHDSLFSKLHTGFAEKPYARYTSSPSFSEDYAFSVETIGNKNYIIANSFSEN